jgi:hypothetical protein
MVCRYLVVFLGLAAAAQLSTANDCDAAVQSPISLPVRNVTLAGQNIRRGLEVQLGTPPQLLAVAISRYVHACFKFNPPSSSRWPAKY